MPRDEIQTHNYWRAKSRSHFIPCDRLGHAAERRSARVIVHCLGTVWYVNTSWIHIIRHSYYNLIRSKLWLSQRNGRRGGRQCAMLFAVDEHFHPDRVQIVVCCHLVATGVGQGWSISATATAAAAASTAQLLARVPPL